MRKLLLTLLLAVSIAVLPLFGAAAVKEEVRHSPFSAVQLSKADAAAVATLGDNEMKPEYIRYLSLHNFPEAEREEVKAIVDLVLGALNARYRRIKRTAPVPATGPPVVLRVNLKDYGISPEAWDRLAEKGSGPTPLPDPYFHKFIEAVDLFVSKDWVPTVAVTRVEDVVVENTSEIQIVAPGSFTVTFNDGVVRSGKASTRSFNVKDVTSAISYTAKIAGTYGGVAYEVNKEFSVYPGCCSKLVIVTPEYEKVRRKDKVLAAAPWIAIEPKKEDRGKTIASLVSVTQTKNPILRADWFCVFATLAPAYYDLLGLPLRDNPNKEAAKKKPKVFLERDFEKLMNVDRKKAAKDIIAAITDTRIVTLHNRILRRFNTVTGVSGGAYWASTDTDKGIDDHDYLNQLANFENPEFAATEIIASGRSGLHHYAVADNKGVLLDLAAAAVAQHSDAMPTKYQDKQVFVARNCMLCHASGMIPVKDKVRRLAQKNIRLFITEKAKPKDDDTALKLQEAFEPHPQDLIDLDNARFAASVRAACGKDPKVIAQAQEKLIWSYWDRPVTLERMAWDSGLTPAKLKALLQEGINLDYTLTSVLQEPEESVAILTWERQGFAALMEYLISHTPRGKG